ncbi:MAG: amidohydrolase [Spirochaetales bacterium]|nr:amidohydrolase [Spirochaetales bacterium]
MYDKINETSESIKDNLFKWRRDFHQYPEAGWFEMRTSSIIARRLTELGYKVLSGAEVCDAASRMGLPSAGELEVNYKRAIEQGADSEFVKKTAGGFTGVIGILECGEGPTVALRFDIDALGVVESVSSEHFPYKNNFISKNSGFMHACGHDGHTTVGLGVAEVLFSIREKLHGTVKLIFQPAEEGVRGAKSIVKKGHLDDVDFLLGAHMGGDLNISSSLIGIGNGYSLATTKFDVVFRGKAAHAGVSPELGNSAMLAAATTVMNLNSIPRHGSSSTRVNVGKLSAGTSRNVICDRAFLEVEVRGDSTEANNYMCDYAFRIIRSAAEMHGCSSKIKLMGSAESTCNSPELSERIKSVCSEELGLKVKRFDDKASGSEDFSYMSERVKQKGGQSCYFLNISRCTAPLHNEKFDFDESALVYGVKAFSGITYDLLK